MAPCARGSSFIDEQSVNKFFNRFWSSDRSSSTIDHHRRHRSMINYFNSSYFSNDLRPRLNELCELVGCMIPKGKFSIPILNNTKNTLLSQSFEQSMSANDTATLVIDPVPSDIAKLPVWPSIYSETIKLFSDTATAYWSSICSVHGMTAFVRWESASHGIIVCCSGASTAANSIGATFDASIWYIPIFIVFGQALPHTRLALHVITKWPSGWAQRTAFDSQHTISMPDTINGIPIIYHDNRKTYFTLTSSDKIEYYIKFAPRALHHPMSIPMSIPCVYVSDLSKGENGVDGVEEECEADGRYIFYSADLVTDSNNDVKVVNFL